MDEKKEAVDLFVGVLGVYALRLLIIFPTYSSLVSVYMKYVVGNLKPGLYRLILATPCIIGNLIVPMYLNSGFGLIDLTLVPFFVITSFFCSLRVRI